MNQKGEITLMSCLLILGLTGLLLLCSLELRKSYGLLQKRTHLFLCVKETKGELHRFMTLMGRSNWAIKNVNRASLVMLFIPGLQGAAMNVQKTKKYLQYLQEARFVSYLKSLKDIKGKSCPLDPRLFITPFVLGTRLLKRDAEGAAILRNKQWTYAFFTKPYFLSLTIKDAGWERTHPQMEYLTEEKAAKLFSLSSFR
jgi:hypothetical protein